MSFVPAYIYTDFVWGSDLQHLLRVNLAMPGPCTFGQTKHLREQSWFPPLYYTGRGRSFCYVPTIERLFSHQMGVGASSCASVFVAIYYMYI